MALPIAKLTILVGAGIVGSVLAKEGRVPDFSDFVSGAFKLVLKPIRRNESASADKKPPSDALIAQVNNLRQELQLLARDRTITIVNASGTGGRKYGTIIVIAVVGYGYIWWKGWKLPDLMFATRRSLSDACTSIGNQLGKLYESVEDAKRKLSVKINRLDSGLDECAALTKNTKEEVSVIQREADTICGDFKSVRVAVHVLESKIKEIEGKQASSSSSSRSALELPPVSPSSRVSPSSSSRLFLEQPSVTPPSRSGSLPPKLSTDPTSPNSAGPYQEGNGISDVINFSSSHADSTRIPPTGNKTPNGSSSGLFGLGLSGISMDPTLGRMSLPIGTAAQRCLSSVQSIIISLSDTLFGLLEWAREGKVPLNCYGFVCSQYQYGIEYKLFTSMFDSPLILLSRMEALLCLPWAFNRAGYNLGRTGCSPNLAASLLSTPSVLQPLPIFCKSSSSADRLVWKRESNGAFFLLVLCFVIEASKSRPLALFALMVIRRWNTCCSIVP
ncbi:bZIP transcription factor 55 precursor [Senna tora]|uniref:BZIP transcription factor 55 n=1 Tax=Senna tora TaxID=362788 RepID=A0A835CED5_9FABA|nr:bZIP transcription factor 55 precursor [Senna tora]